MAIDEANFDRPGVFASHAPRLLVFGEGEIAGSAMEVFRQSGRLPFMLQKQLSMRAIISFNVIERTSAQRSPHRMGMPPALVFKDNGAGLAQAEFFLRFFNRRLEFRHAAHFPVPADLY